MFRADKPQKGRLRQFMQCDLDILGDNTILAEIELIAATSTMLNYLYFSYDKIVFVLDKQEFMEGRMIDYSQQNKRAWKYNAYDFWVNNSGKPSDRVMVRILPLIFRCKTGVTSFRD